MEMSICADMTSLVLDGSCGGEGGGAAVTVKVVVGSCSGEGGGGDVVTVRAVVQLCW